MEGRFNRVTEEFSRKKCVGPSPSKVCLDFLKPAKEIPKE
jgi:hypothetical protein